MVLAVTAANLGVTWVGIEATTVITAFLVGHRGTRTALEATWKYVIVCSVGIAMAFLGTVLLYFAARHAGLGDTLDWTALRTHAAALDPSTTRMAAGLLIVGYGAKAGLVPFHSWLADAHSQAPAPVSALMSGVLLSVAMSIVIRLRGLLDPAAGAGFVRAELLTVGLATVAVAALLMTVTPDLKRLLAYSSMENMGLIAIAAAAGGRIAVGAILLHVLAHGGGKTVLFLGSGQLQTAHRSTALADITGVLRRSRLVGGSFAAGVVVLAGLPPFAVFASEIGIARGLADAHLGWVLAAALAAVVVAFAALVRDTGGMLLGDPGPHAPRISAPAPIAAALVAGVAASLVLGVTAGPLAGLFELAATQQAVSR
jgi:hydrogenase-4 component F